MHRLTRLTLVAALVAAPFAAHARSSYLTTFNTKYKTASTVLDSCGTCHGSGGTSTWNPYGDELRTDIAAGQSIGTALTTAEPKDSDGDKYTNLTEIQALSFPGDAKSVPVVAPPPAPLIAVSPTSLAFGNVDVGAASAAQTVNVSNGGNATLSVTISRCSGTSTEFSTSVGSLSVAAGGRGSFTVTYAPTATGTDSGCVALANNSSTTPVNVNVSGAGQAVVVPAPKIAVAPTSLSFGTVTVGSSAQQQTVVSNGGNADLVVSSVARCGGTSTEFTASPATFTVAAGGSQTVTVAYAPADATTDSGCVAIASNDTAAGTQNVTVSGTGQAAQAAVADVDITRFTVAKRLDISRGGTTTPKLAVVNAGTVAVVPGTPTAVTITVEAVDAAGAVAYTASDNALSLAPGATGKVAFPTFVPTAPADLTWTVTLVDQDPDVDTASAATKIVP